MRQQIADNNEEIMKSKEEINQLKIQIVTVLRQQARDMEMAQNAGGQSDVQSAVQDL